jgi:hypothetical protein
MNNGSIGGSNQLLTMHEAADYVRRSYKNYASSYRRWGIAAHRIQGRVYFRVRDLESFLSSVREVA